MGNRHCKPDTVVLASGYMVPKSGEEEVLRTYYLPSLLHRLLNKYVRETSQFEVENPFSPFDLSFYTDNNRISWFLQDRHHSDLNHSLRWRLAKDHKQKERKNILHLMMRKYNEQEQFSEKKGKENSYSSLFFLQALWFMIATWLHSIFVMCHVCTHTDAMLILFIFFLFHIKEV